MARYRKIDPRMWNDEKIRALSDDGKLGFLFVLTHPGMTALGAMRASVDGLAAELGWPRKRFDAAFSESVAAGMLNVDRASCYVEAPNFLRYNEPEGPNSVAGAWLAALDLIPECQLRRALVVRCRRYLDAKSPEYRKAIKPEVWRAFPAIDPPHSSSDGVGDASRMDTGDPSPDPCPIQEQEQEQEQESISDGGMDGPSFGAFWSVYPGRNGHKRDKAKAEAVWKKLDGEDRKNAIEDVRHRREHDPQWRNGYSKDAHRYLRDRNWNDERVVEPEQPYVPRLVS